MRIISHSVSRWQLESDRETITLERSPAPSWAKNIGQDQFGIWADLSVGEVYQRLRWVPPGRFFMGTPKSEEGRQAWELPQHHVTLTSGFWMFDSPCPQHLWSAVMNDNPSFFKGSLRPVETIRWGDCQEFMSRLNKRFKNLNLVLPSEAQWEYACRAGTSTVRYGGVDDIAWYEQNSNRETKNVKLKAPNALGLYDMLGNVYEWCHDNWHQTSETLSVVDPLFETDAVDDRVIRGDNRVVRGGGWDNSAAYVRAASRDRWQPGARRNDVGFRCLSSN